MKRCNMITKQKKKTTKIYTKAYLDRKLREQTFRFVSFLNPPFICQ